MSESHAMPSMPSPGSSTSHSDESTQSMSLLGGVARPEGIPQADETDFASADQKGGKRSLSTGTIVVIVVALAAAGALYTMHLTQGDIAATGDSQVEAKMEQIIAKLTNPGTLAKDSPLRPEVRTSLFQDTAAIVATLDQNLTDQQVPVEYVKKNPFTLPIKKQTKQVVRDTSDQERQAQIQRLRGDLKRMKLQSVMGSGNSLVAVIDGDLYQPGQTIGKFKITNIDANTMTVTLRAMDQNFKLTMGE